MLGHGAAELLDGLADFGPDVLMGLIGPGLAGDFLSPELFLRLGGAEEIGGQFGAAHVIEDLLALF